MRDMFRELVANNPLIGAYDYIFSFDTEFVRGCYLNLIPDDRNGVVSYQGTLIDTTTGEIIQVRHTTTSARREARLGFQALIGRALCAAMDAGMATRADIAECVDRKGNPRRLRVAVIAHYSRADVGGFRNFTAIRDDFDMVRGTFLSIELPATTDIPLMDGGRVAASLDMFDTILLCPDKFRSLDKIGGLIGFEKLKLPNVIDEAGETVRGIERMDLCLRQYPDAYWRYAMRDTEVCLAFFLHFSRYAASLNLSKIPKTVASAGVAAFKAMTGIDTLAALTGREIDEKGRLADLVPEHRHILATLADAYLGGRNECFEVGDISGEFTDIDLKGAYVGALAFIRPMDWGDVEHTNDLDRLAQLDEPSAAYVDFEFPAGTMFPCLPVYAGGEGLLYPLSGSTTVIGAELHLARRMGAKIKVRTGVRIHWASQDRPFVEYARGVNRDRAEAPSKLFEQLAKTRGNALYGKTGQSVGSFKSDPQIKMIFSNRRGRSEELPSSAITSAIVAAYASGLCRATVSEILWRLDAIGAQIISVTTDGILGVFTRADADAATDGDLCRLFSGLRVLVDAKRSPGVIEVKHTASRVISIKTRGVIGIESTMRNDKGEIEWLMARAGHRLSVEPDDDADDVHQFAEIYRNRTPETMFYRAEFVSPRRQYFAGGDLIETYRMTTASLEYDLKRRPINVRDAHGLIRFETVPWRDITEFRRWRERFDKWRKTTPALLKTAADWDEFLGWLDAGCPRRKASRRSPLMGAIRTAVAKRLPGFDGLWRAPGHRSGSGDNRPGKREAIAAIGAAMGERITLAMVQNDARSETDPRTNPVSKIVSGDAARVCALGEMITLTAIETLLTTDAATHLRREIFGGNDADRKISPKGLSKYGANYMPPSQGTEMTQENTDLSNLGLVTIKTGLGGRGELLQLADGDAAPAATPETAPAETPAASTTATPRRPAGLLDATDIAHIAAIDAILAGEFKIGAMTIRRARDFMAHQERMAAKAGRIRPAEAPGDRLLTTRVIALSMKTGMGIAQARDTFITILERARPDAAPDAA